MYSPLQQHNPKRKAVAGYQKFSGSVPSNSRDGNNAPQMKSLLPGTTKNNKNGHSIEAQSNRGKPHERTNAPSKRDNDYISPGKPPTYRKANIKGNSGNLLSPINYQGKKLQLNQKLMNNEQYQLPGANQQQFQGYDSHRIQNMNAMGGMPASDYGNGMHSG